MTKTILTLMTATALSAASLAVTPQPAKAAAWWVAPAIVGGVVVGVGAGAAVAGSARVYAYEEPGYAYESGYYASGPNIYVRTYPGYRCHIVRQRVDGYWQRARVCN